MPITQREAYKTELDKIHDLLQGLTEMQGLSFTDQDLGRDLKALWKTGFGQIYERLLAIFQKALAVLPPNLVGPYVDLAQKTLTGLALALEIQ